MTTTDRGTTRRVSPSAWAFNRAGDSNSVLSARVSVPSNAPPPDEADIFFCNNVTGFLGVYAPITRTISARDGQGFRHFTLKYHDLS